MWQSSRRKEGRRKKKENIKIRYMEQRNRIDLDNRKYKKRLIKMKRISKKIRPVFSN